MITLICKTCGKSYERSPSKVRYYGSSYCSLKCGGNEKGENKASEEVRKQRLKDYWKRYYEANKELLREKSKEKYRMNRQDPAKLAELKAKNKIRFKELKIEVMNAYGGLVCSCDHDGVPCGEHPLEFLALDHINGERLIPKDPTGQSLYRTLKKESYPSGFRVLCHNCNCSLGFFGYCPHSKTEKQERWHEKSTNVVIIA